MKGEFLFLGSGGSSGAPMIGCTCPVCSSSDPHNKRLRPSALITCGEKKILIDSGPDFRYQALRYQINELDGLILTHSHFDHLAGIDDLRVYYLHSKKPLPVLLSKATFQDLKRRYDYLFREKSWGVSLPVQLDFHVLEQERGTIHFLDWEIGYMQYDQAGMPVMGYRFGSLAYVSDIRNYPETIFADLAGVKILILSVLRHEASKLHLNVEEGVAFAQKVGAEQTYFTHMGHELEYVETNAHLPQGIQLGYDGLKFGFEYGRC